jgi:signal transduction histidine kinase
MSLDGLSDAMLAQSPACQWAVDSNHVFQEIYGDPSSLFGMPASELAGRPVRDLREPALAASWSDRFSRALAGEVLSLRERRADAIWNVSVFPIRLDGQICYAGALAREMTPWGKADHELRRTVLSALDAQVFERNTLSRFLHDSVGQNLTALGLQLDLMRMDLERDPAICLRIGEAQKLLEVMMEQVREYSFQLNPSTVERAGLRAALDRLVIRIRERFAGTVRLNVDPSLKLDKSIAIPLYQIAEESVENAVQHSSCSTIEIAVKSTRAGTFLEIRDNGHGFDPADLSGGGRGLGLLSMEHYAAQAGLDLSIVSSRETGTTVRAVAQGV